MRPDHFKTASQLKANNNFVIGGAILNEKGDKLFEFKPTPTQAVDAINTRQTVSLMEGAIDHGCRDH